MAIPDPHRTSKLIALWKKVAEELDAMNQISASIAGGSRRVAQFLDVEKVAEIMATENTTPDDIGAESAAHMKAAGENLHQLNLRAISLAETVQKIGELAWEEVASNQLQLDPLAAIRNSN